MENKIKIQCAYCGKDLFKDANIYRTKRNGGQRDFYHMPCSRRKNRLFNI